MTIIDDVGETIVIREVTRAIDEYGDETDTNNDTNVTGVVELVSADEEIIKSGILNFGDAVGYFESNDINTIKTGNKVRHNSIWYVITAVLDQKIGGTGMHIEAYLKRIETQVYEE